MNCKFNKSVMSPLMAVAWNIILVYVMYSVARVEYFLENYGYFHHVLSEGHLGTLFYGSLFMDTPAIMYTNVLWMLMILFPLHWKENAVYQQVCKWLFVIINTLAFAVNMADSVYFRYVLRRTTSSVFSEFQGEDNLGLIFGVELLRHWYLVVLTICLAVFLWKLYFMPWMDIKRQPKVRYYLLQTFCLAFAILFIVSGMRGGYLNHWYQYLLAVPLLYLAYKELRSQGAKESGSQGVKESRSRGKWRGGLEGALAFILIVTAPIGGWCHMDIRPTAVSDAGQYTDHPQDVALILNTPFTLLRTIGKEVYYDPGYFPDKAELERIYTPLHKPSQKRAGKKNVVILIMESFGREYIGGFNKEVLGEKYKGYTPFVDSLMQHSVTFRYSYCNSQQSIDGMPAILASIPRIIKPFVLTPQALNRINGIAGYLNEEGYQTAFFHGARDGSMGFNGFANTIGYEAYYGREEFNQDKRFGGDADFDGFWAVWDEPFLQYFALKMTEMKQPFHTTVFTASSHHPFRVPQQYEGRFPKGTMEIHQCIGYSDYALRRFFDTARKQPWFNNTVFVLTSDHTNMREHDEYKSDIGVYCSPIIIYDPSGELQPGMRNAIAQHIDIVPTILGYIGYDKPYVAFGIDLLNTPAEDTWAVTEIEGVYQYCKHGYILQFDGQKTIAVYRLTDQAMRHNLLGKVKEQAQMELELKAFIQQYMDRMLEDRLR